MVSRESFRQDDGALWRIYHIERGFLVLTSRGQELVSERPDFWKEFRAYQSVAAAEQSGRSAVASTLAVERGVRGYFASGGNSDVYTFADGLAVKEATQTQSLWNALQRMDRLCTVMEKGKVPRWLNIPVHYGMMVSGNLQRQYMLMDKVDSGITVQDVDSYMTERDLMTDIKKTQIEREFGGISLAEHAEITERAGQVEIVLSDALSAEDLDPKDYLPDPHIGNMLVERSRTPVGSSNFKLWLIDQ